MKKVVKTFIDPALIEQGVIKGRIEGEIKGKNDGLIEAILENLSELGVVSEELSETIRLENNFVKLKNWSKISARSNSIDDFKRKIGMK
ncbi:hypothetical protein [Paenibacillus sp. LHD-38]|uniref:hypothetical protein n=1 Tax=Paenibacillus sp. LHD-38 TaxID=3072143 RepID=UPI00280C5F0A|nr:hypothetical protein [Paenibacillus sp. LHD-38]MDQ8738684.1 hypothetical protein [Paenibacillus sp. LHD-38]